MFARLDVWSFGLVAVVLVGAIAVGEEKLAKPHPHLICTPPLTQEDFQVFVELHKPCAVVTKEKRLSELAEELAELIDVEVTVDVPAIRRLKLRKAKLEVDPNIQLTAQHHRMTLQEILWDVLPPLRLDYRVVNGKLVITTRVECQRHLVTWTFPLTGVCAKGEEFDALVHEVRAMNPREDWEWLGGYASLKPDKANHCFTMIHAQSNQDRVLDFLTKRRARGLASSEPPEGGQKRKLLLANFH